MSAKVSKKNYHEIVEQAVAEIERAGGKVTLDNVIAITGGSKREINVALREVRERRERHDELLSRAPDMTDEARRLFATVWSEAHRVASEDFNRILRDMRSEIERKEKSLGETDRLHEEAEKKCEDLEREAADSEEQRSRLEVEVARLEKELVIAHARLSEREAVFAQFIARTKDGEEERGEEAGEDATEQGTRIRA